MKRLFDVMIEAMDNAREGITISDVNLPDNPLIYVNKGFLKMTGYSYEEMINSNCRYLQGPLTDQACVDQIRMALEAKTGIKVEIINYRKNGEPFWNDLSITPIFNAQHELTHFIGIQDDITFLKEKRRLKTALDKQQAIAGAVLSTEERERNRLGMELHDNVNQMLGASKLYLSLALRPDNSDETHLIKGFDIIEEVIEEVRHLSRNQVTPKFNQKKLIQILSELISDIERSGVVHIAFDHSAFEPQALNENVQLVIYRITQEQINNIIKHAGASTVTIDLRTQHDICYLAIRDNGKGFIEAEVVKGIGFSNMRSRIEAVNGSLVIHSSPGQGTSLMVEIPLKCKVPVI